MSSRKRWSLNSSFRSLSVFIFLFLIQYRMLAFSLFSWSSAFVIEFFDGVVESGTQGFLFFIRRCLLAFIYAHRMRVFAERFPKLGSEHFPYQLHVASRNIAVFFEALQGNGHRLFEILRDSVHALSLYALRLFAESFQIFLEFQVFALDPAEL